MPAASSQLPERRVRSAAVASFIAICILISLGVWQLHRRAWKQGVLDDITRAEQSPAVKLVGTPGRFTKVLAQGVWRPGIALYGVEVREAANGSPVLGAQKLQILTRDGAPPLLVDQGWVPTQGAAPAESIGAATIEGYVRLPEQAGMLSADDDLAGRHFYTLNPASIGAALGAPDVAPFTLVALGHATQGGPVPAESLPRPPNDHLQYAITWFGLAAALAGVFGVWAIRKGQGPGSR